MAELDERTRRYVDRLRDRGAPSDAAKQRMYANLEAQLGGGGGDDDPSGDPPSELPHGSGAGNGAWLAKVVGATAGLTAGGLVGLRLGVELVRALTSAPQIDTQRDDPPEQPVALASALDRDEVELATLEPAPPDEAIEPSRPTSRHQLVDDREAAPRAAGPSVSGSTLAAELALLEAAHAARDPAAALLELDRHLAQFPRGELADERELLRVETLCRLGRQADAHALAERFLLERPGSALRQRIAAACPAPGEPKKN
jgi:hypothetical protein